MIIYHHTPDGLLVGPGLADPDPLEDGRWLIPAYATEQVPPEVTEGFLARFDGTRWALEEIPPPPPEPEPEPPGIPQVVSRFQARAALHLAGLLETVEAMMQAPETPVLASLAWTDALEFRRTSPTVQAMAQALGLTEAQIDTLFSTAATIEA